jgi:hypothetical protein
MSGRRLVRKAESSVERGPLNVAELARTIADRSEQLMQPRKR